MFRSLGWGSINCYELLYVKVVFIYNLKTPAMLELSTELSVLSKPAWPLWAILKCRVRHTFRRRTSQVSSNRVNSSFLIQITALTASPFVDEVQVFLFCWMRVKPLVEVRLILLLILFLGVIALLYDVLFVPFNLGLQLFVLFCLASLLVELCIKKFDFVGDLLSAAKCFVILSFLPHKVPLTVLSLSPHLLSVLEVHLFDFTICCFDFVRELVRNCLFSEQGRPDVDQFLN